MSMHELKIAFSYAINAVWLFISDAIASFMAIGVIFIMELFGSFSEQKVDWWVKTLVYVIGAVILWAYSIRKIKNAKATELKNLAETEKIKHETEAIKLDNQIGKEAFHSLSLQEILYRQEQIRKELGNEKYEQHVAEIKKQMEGKV